MTDIGDSGIYWHCGVTAVEWNDLVIAKNSALYSFVFVTVYCFKVKSFHDQFTLEIQPIKKMCRRIPTILLPIYLIDITVYV